MYQNDGVREPEAFPTRGAPLGPAKLPDAMSRAFLSLPGGTSAGRGVVELGGARTAAVP